MLPLLLASLLPGSPATEVDRAVASLVRDQLLVRLAKPMAIKHPLFTGSITAVTPAKTLVVTARGLSLQNDTVSATVSVAGEWSLVGKLKMGKETPQVKLRLKARVDVTGGARIVKVRGVFLARPQVTDLALASAEVVSLDPEPFFGASFALPALMGTLLKTSKASLLKDIAAALEPLELPRPALVPALAGKTDNATLRQYAQAMMASHLSQYNSAKDSYPIDERTPFLEVTGKAWLDTPVRNLKVALTRLDLREGVLYVGGFVETPVLAACRIEVPGVVDGLADVTTGVRVDFDGDLTMKDGKPGGCNIYRLDAKLSSFDTGAGPFRAVRRVLDGLVARMAAAKAAEARVNLEKLGGGPDRSRLVQTSYRQVLRRGADPAGLRDWVKFLGKHTPRELMVALASSAEYENANLKGKNARAMAQTLWLLVLRRDPSPAELASASSFFKKRETVYQERRVRVGLLRHETRRVAVGTRARNSRDLLRLLAESQEYRDRFGDGLPR